MAAMNVTGAVQLGSLAKSAHSALRPPSLRAKPRGSHYARLLRLILSNITRARASAQRLVLGFLGIARLELWVIVPHLPTSEADPAGWVSLSKKKVIRSILPQIAVVGIGDAARPSVPHLTLPRYKPDLGREMALGLRIAGFATLPTKAPADRASWLITSARADLLAELATEPSDFDQHASCPAVAGLGDSLAARRRSTVISAPRQTKIGVELSPIRAESVQVVSRAGSSAG